MEELFKKSVVKGFLFSGFTDVGPQPIYTFPLPLEEGEGTTSIDRSEETFRLTNRDYMQVSIKNLSLLMSDSLAPQKQNKEKTQYFAIIPYPDFHLTSLTFFHYVQIGEANILKETSFSIFVDEDRRSFLYNNHNSIRTLVLSFFQEFDQVISKELKPQEDVNFYFWNLMEHLIDLEKTPSTPLTTERKMKILLSGLDDSGKTSFLLSVNREFSKILGLKPTKGASVKSIHALGATIFLWDLGGQTGFREKYLRKSDIYLYETDLLFYFIDIKNDERFQESLDYLKQIRSILYDKFKQNTPIIYILSKADIDIVNDGQIQRNIEHIKSELNDLSNGTFEMYLTSIFDVVSIMRAFSSGISKLSPNRALIDYNLKNLSLKVGSKLSLLLSEEGLVLADFYSENILNVLNTTQSEELIMNVFEMTAPQFAMIFKIFSQFKTLRKNEAIFDIANSKILIKRISTLENMKKIFILFLFEKNRYKEKIDSLLPGFINRIKDLIIGYIA
jgi:GTPase SAR1 family protein